MSFFDDVSHAIGTDGSGGGAVVEIGKALGTGDSTTGLLNNPGVKEAATAAAIYYGLDSFGAFDQAGGASAFANGGANVIGQVGPGLSDYLTQVPGAIVSGVNSGIQTLGAINGLRALTAKPAASSGFSNSPVYRVNANGVPVPVVSAAQNGAAGKAAAAPAAAAAGAKDSTLTMLASALTVAAILYQFSKGK